MCQQWGLEPEPYLAGLGLKPMFKQSLQELVEKRVNFTDIVFVFFNIVVELALTVPELINVNESLPLSLKCTLLGGETGATFQWFKDGEKTSETGSTLEMSASRALNGSKYHCEASANSINGKSNEALVTVNCKLIYCWGEFF